MQKLHFGLHIGRDGCTQGHQGESAYYPEGFSCCVRQIGAYDQDEDEYFAGKRTHSKEKWKAQRVLGNIGQIITVKV